MGSYMQTSCLRNNAHFYHMVVFQKNNSFLFCSMHIIHDTLCNYFIICMYECQEYFTKWQGNRMVSILYKNSIENSICAYFIP